MIPLDPDQLSAVYAVDPRIVCRAAPGAGKTRVLAGRVRRLLEDGVPPSAILCVTFTRRATAEMRERIGEEGVTVATFHSWAASVLREHGHHVGLSTTFTVCDEQDRDELVLFVGAELGLSFKTVGRLWAESTVRERFDAHMREAHAVDYDGLEVAFERLLATPEVTGALRGRHRHVLVDEGQDTSAKQQRMLTAFDPENLFVVGDHAQSLYAFRGASVEGFHALTEGWTVLGLRRNYRSRPGIVRAATAIGARMRPPGLEQMPIRDGAGDEAAVLRGHGVDIAADIVRACGGRWTDCAVLASTWADLDDLAQQLGAAGVPHVVARRRAGPWSSPAARRVVAVIRAALNLNDHLSWRSALRLRLPEWARLRSQSLTEERAIGELVLEEPERYGARDLAWLADSYGTARELVPALMRRLDVDPHLLELFDAWSNENAAAGLREFVDWYAGRDAGEGDVVEAVDAVTLITIHGAKGLEWPLVWVLGCAEGRFPRGEKDEEEERRRFYVASTRARDRLRWCCEPQATVSRFVNEAMNAGNARTEAA